jgi:uncharacterized membrane protein
LIMFHQPPDEVVGHACVQSCFTRVRGHVHKIVVGFHCDIFGFGFKKFLLQFIFLFSSFPQGNCNSM